MAKSVRTGARSRAPAARRTTARGPKGRPKRSKRALSGATRRSRGARRDEAASAARPTTRQSPPGRAYTFTPELIAWGKDRWENSNDSRRVIALEFGVKPTTLQRYADTWGWKPRVTPPRDLSPATRLLIETEKLAAEANAAAVTGDNSDAQESRAARAEKLARALDAQIEELERVQAAVRQMRRPSTLDLTRMSTSITRLIASQFDLERVRHGLPKERASYEDDMPADLDAFRADLARRIRAFVESRPGSEAGDGEDPAAVLATPQL